MQSVEELMAAQARGEVNPFRDYHPITPLEFIKCVLLLPLALLRLVLMLILFALVCTVSLPITCGIDPSKPYSRCRGAIVACLQWVLARGTLLLMGFWLVEHQGETIISNVDGQRTVLAVAPHCSLVDAMAVASIGGAVSPLALSWVRYSNEPHLNSHVSNEPVTPKWVVTRSLTTR